MAHITLQLIEGLERGREFRDLPTPVSIGREEENVIRLNDERISRFHAKIQEDGGRIILTDLDSTNGTRVNGHPIQMRVLQVGDEVAIGRCLLIFGSREEIAKRAKEIDSERRPAVRPGQETIAADPLSAKDQDNSGTLNLDSNDASVEDQPSELFPKGPPPLPQQMRPLQRAELSDLLAYLHDQLRLVIEASLEANPGQEEGTREMRFGWREWQRILHVEMELARNLRRLAEPDDN